MSGEGGILDIRARIAALEAAGGVSTVDWVDVTGKPATFAPAPHTHAQSDVTGLVAALAEKQGALVSGSTIKTLNGESLLGPGDVVIAGGGATVSSATIIMARGFEVYATVTDATIAPGDLVMISIAPGTDDDENTADMLDLVTISATAGTGQFAACLTFAVITSGPIKINYWKA